jgi:hypothetical protein
MADKNENAYVKLRYYVFCHDAKGHQMNIGPQYMWVESFDNALFTSSLETAKSWCEWASPLPYVVIGSVSVFVNPGALILAKSPQKTVDI